MNLQEGAVGVVGSIAYCDQRPWVLNTTVRENILFGQPYDEERFDRAVHVANLEEDIRVLPGGIQPFIEQNTNWFERQLINTQLAGEFKFGDTRLFY
jgi:ABC-type multidrug transport system fused ATPase/permease subunit